MIEIFTVKFLVQSAASGLIGHWAVKGIEAISARVWEMIQEGRSSEEIAQAIELEGVEEDVLAFSQKLLDRSVYYSDDLEAAKRPSDLVALFARLLSLADEIATAECFDVLLRGSPLGPVSLTLILVSNRTERPIDFVAEGVKLRLPWRGYTSSWNSGVYIVPLLKKDTPDSIFEKYCSDITFLRGQRDDRLWCFSPLNERHFAGSLCDYEVRDITASTVEYFRPMPKTVDSGRFGSDPFEGKDLGLCKNWSDGLKSMIKDLVTIRNLGFLPPDQWPRLQEVENLLKQLR